MHNIISILKKSYKGLLLALFLLSFTYQVNAKSINSSSSFIDASTRSYFDDVYNREDYKYSVLSTEYVSNVGGYNSTTYYYLCLTNDKPDVSNTDSISATCDKLYRYHRSASIYEVDKLSDNQLVVSNALYYFQDSKHYLTTTYLFILVLVLVVFLFYVIMRDLLRS